MIAEVPRVTLQHRDFMQSPPVFEQALQSPRRGGRHLDLCDSGQAALLIGQCSTDYVLHRGVARSDDALLRKDVHQFPEDINRLPTDCCHVLSLGLEFLLYRSIAAPIMAEFEDEPLLLETCAFGDGRILIPELGKAGLHNIICVFFHLPQIEDEEQPASLEVSQLENEE